MKFNVFRKFVLTALCSLGLSAWAQEVHHTYEVPAMDAEVQVKAEEVVNKSMDDPEVANKVFMKLLRGIQSKKEQLVAAGTYFLDNNVISAAKLCADKVVEAEPEYVPGLMFAGEMWMKRQDWGRAGQMFDAVLALDTANVEALKVCAIVYKNVNPFAAIDYLERIKAADPSYYDADRLMGDIKYKADLFAEAVACYESYYKGVPKTKEEIDIRSCENFLLSLYSQAKFDRIAELVPEMLAFDAQNLVFRRMDFFSKVNLIADAMDPEAAAATAAQAQAYILNKEYDDSLYVSLDYEYSSALAKEQGDIPAAVKWMELAVQKDETKAANVKELANLYARNNQAELGLETYGKFLALLGDKADLGDTFLYGVKYYQASKGEGVAPEKAQEYMQKADAIFADVMQKKPDYVQAVAYRARLHVVDSSKPEVTPRDYYLKVLEVSEAEADKYKSYRFEACKYLFFYAVSVDPVDIELAKKVHAIAAGISPDDDFVKNAGQYIQMLSK